MVKALDLEERAERQALRLTERLRGELGDGWEYDAYTTPGKTIAVVVATRGFWSVRLETTTRPGGTWREEAYRVWYGWRYGDGQTAGTWREARDKVLQDLRQRAGRAAALAARATREAEEHP